MNASALIFMLIAWAIVIALMVYSFRKIL